MQVTIVYFVIYAYNSVEDCLQKQLIWPFFKKNQTK